MADKKSTDTSNTPDGMIDTPTGEKYVATYGAYEDARNRGLPAADQMMSPPEGYEGAVIATEAEYEKAVASGDPMAERMIESPGGRPLSISDIDYTRSLIEPGLEAQAAKNSPKNSASIEGEPKGYRDYFDELPSQAAGASNLPDGMIDTPDGVKYVASYEAYVSAHSSGEVFHDKMVPAPKDYTGKVIVTQQEYDIGIENKSPSIAAQGIVLEAEAAGFRSGFENIDRAVEDVPRARAYEIDKDVTGMVQTQEGTRYVATFGAYDEARNRGLPGADQMMSPPEGYEGAVIATEAEYERAVASGDPMAERMIESPGGRPLSISDIDYTRSLIEPGLEAQAAKSSPRNSASIEGAPKGYGEYFDGRTSEVASGSNLPDGMIDTPDGVKYVASYEAYISAHSSGEVFHDNMVPAPKDYTGKVIVTQQEYDIGIENKSPSIAAQGIVLEAEAAGFRSEFGNTAGPIDDAPQIKSVEIDEGITAAPVSEAALGNQDVEGLKIDGGVDVDALDGAQVSDVSDALTASTDGSQKGLSETFDGVRNSAPDSPASPTAQRTIDLPDVDIANTRMNSFTQLGGSSAGLAMGIVGLDNAIERGDTTGIMVAGADVLISSADLALDGSMALGNTVSPALQGMAMKANILITVADGVYQISQEEGLENKVARGTAVTATTATAFAVGGAATTIVTGGVAATVGVAAAPVVAAIAVGMTTDAAVDAFKAEQSFDDLIAENEQGVKVGEATELSGAPALQNYEHLNAFAILEGTSPFEDEGLNRQAVAQNILKHEYSNDPEALDKLEEEIQAKVDEHDKIIEENDSWVPDYTRVFGQDEVQTKMQAQIDRTHYVAALNELKDYREEVGEYSAAIDNENTVENIASVENVQNVENAENGISITAYHQISEWSPAETIIEGNPVLTEGPWEDSLASVTVKEGDAVWNIVEEQLGSSDPQDIVRGIKLIQDNNADLDINLIHPGQEINMPEEGLIAALENFEDGEYSLVAEVDDDHSTSNSDMSMNNTEVAPSTVSATEYAQNATGPTAFTV
jgi:hypothetical protein